METSPQTRQQLAAAYRISYRTFSRWLKRAGIELSSGLLTPKELELIYEVFGPPPIAKQKEEPPAKAIN